MSLLTRDRDDAAARTRRPAVVEIVGTPQPTSDGRTILATLDAAMPRGLRSQIARFAVIGVISTLAWAGLYSLLRGAGLGSVAANGLALVVTAIGNTAANRRLTFGVTGRAGLARDHGAGLVAFGFAIGITTIAAGALARLAPGASRPVEIVVLAAANVVATAVRFAVLRSSIGRASPLRPI
jgi:putative flippase GtrA